MDIETVQRLVRSKRYQIKFHAAQHALKEGFGERQIIEAVMSGRIIETYEQKQRALICGQIILDSNTSAYLHVVCEQNYPDQVELVTAYVPDGREWEDPPFKRKRRKK